MKKNILFIFVILIIIAGFYTLFSFLNKTTTNNSGKIVIITTLFPTYDFAKNIGGDKVDASLLLPPGVEAHSFEPKPSDVTRINQANIFVYTGEFMEPWAHDIIEGANKKVRIVDASTGIKLSVDNGHDHDHNHETEEHKDEEHYAEEEHHHVHNGVDPHIWLDFDNAIQMASNIEKALEEIDPKNKAYYQDNLNKYQQSLLELDDTYKESLSNCQTKTIVYGGHYAFGYLAKKYGLEYEAAQGFSPDAEPTAKDMISLIEQIKKNNIKYIFYEELSSPKIAETLAKETSAKMLLLNGAHNLSKEDYEKNTSYLTIMKENLANLKIGLICN